MLPVFINLLSTDLIGDGLGPWQGDLSTPALEPATLNYFAGRTARSVGTHRHRSAQEINNHYHAYSSVETNLQTHLFIRARDTTCLLLYYVFTIYTPVQGMPPALYSGESLS